MAIRRNIQYINKDFTELRASLVNYARTYFPTTYNDFTPSSPGMMFMEMAAYVGDVLSFYLDNQIQETYLQYARQTNNLYELAYMFGYKPNVTQVSTVDLDFYQQVPANSLAPDFNYSLFIPANTIVTSIASGSTSFIIQDPIDFSVSSSGDPTEVTVYSVDGSNNPTYFLLKKSRKAISSTINTSTFVFGIPEQFSTVELAANNIVGILDVFDSDGNQWYEVDNLAQDAIFDTITNTAPNDPNFSSYTDTPNLLKIKQVQNRFATRFLDAESLRILFGSGNPNDTTEVIIPNPQNVGLGLPYQQDKLTTAYSPTNFVFTNTFGVAPSNTTLIIRYLVGGGVASNAPVNTLTSINTTGVKFINSNISSNAVAQQTFASLQVNNLSAASGGSSGDSLEEIRQNSLANFQTQLRAVTADDYNIRVLSLPPQYGSISKVYTMQEKATNITVGTPPSAIDIYVLGSNNDGSLKTASLALKQNIITYLQPFRIINDSVKLKDAFIINIGVAFDIIVLPNYNNDQVLTNCINYLINYFNIDNWQINQPIILKQLLTNLDQIEGVQTVQRINVTNLTNTAEGYSEYAYDIQSATYNNVVYPSIDPMIFEVKYPTTDIKGRVVTL